MKDREKVENGQSDENDKSTFISTCVRHLSFSPFVERLSDRDL